MSGGSMNYLYNQVEEAVRYFQDPIIQELIRDVAKLMHDKEWADSGDYADGAYNKTEKEFKEKWLCNCNEHYTGIIEHELNKLKSLLLHSIGRCKYCKDCKYWLHTNNEYGQCKDNKWLTHGYEYGCKDWKQR